MLNLKQHITEAKNVHMEHLEDTILNGGVEGTREVINYLRAFAPTYANSHNPTFNSPPRSFQKLQGHATQDI